MDIGYALHTRYTVPYMESKSINIANQRRSKIYLETIEAQQKKQLYFFRKGFDFQVFYQFFSRDMFAQFEGETVIDSTSEQKALAWENELIDELKQKYSGINVMNKNSNNFDFKRK